MSAGLSSLDLQAFYQKHLHNPPPPLPFVGSLILLSFQNLCTNYICNGFFTIFGSRAFCRSTAHKVERFSCSILILWTAAIWEISAPLLTAEHTMSKVLYLLSEKDCLKRYKLCEPRTFPTHILLTVSGNCAILLDVLTDCFSNATMYRWGLLMVTNLSSWQ